MKRRDTRESLLAWFEPARGPEDLIGVRLAYIDPVERHFERALEAANQAKDTPWALRILHSKSYYANLNQKFFTPDVGWWMSKKHYLDGKASFGGLTRADIELKYRNITIFETREEAIAAAEQQGLI